MRLTRTLFGRQPVDVLSDADPEAPGPSIEVPDVGLRWGTPSDFDYAMTLPPETPASQGIVLDRGGFRFFRGFETHREFGDVAPSEDSPLTLESIKRVTFYLGEHVERTENRTVEGDVTNVQPIIETVREYLEFDFAFAVEGDRGTQPPRQDEPPRPSPKIVEVQATDLSPFRTVVDYAAGIHAVTVGLAFLGNDGAPSNEQTSAVDNAIEFVTPAIGSFGLSLPNWELPAGAADVNAYGIHVASGSGLEVPFGSLYFLNISRIRQDHPELTEIVFDVPYHSGVEYDGLTRDGIIRSEVYRGQALADMLAYYDTVSVMNWPGADFVPFRTENQYQRDGLLGQTATAEEAVVALHDSEKIMRVTIPLDGPDDTPIFTVMPARSPTL